MWAPNRNLRGLSLPYAGEALVIKALNVVAIEAFVTDLHPGAERAHGRKLLDGNNPFHNATQSGYAAAEWLGSTWQVQIGFGKPWNHADTS